MARNFRPPIENPGPVDLHVHTTYSDGEGSPRDVARAFQSQAHNPGEPPGGPAGPSPGHRVLAVTDHVSHLGTFLYTPGVGRAFAEYARDLEDLSAALRADPATDVRLLRGVEISTFPPPVETVSTGALDLTRLDWVLVDGIYVEDAVTRVVELHDYHHDQLDAPCGADGSRHLTFGLAHPAFEHLATRDLEQCAARGIALELNEDKFCKTDMYAIERALEVFSRDELVFSIGSDAHWLRDVGRCTITTQFARSHDLRLVEFPDS